MTEIGTPTFRASDHALKVRDHVTNTTTSSEKIVQPHATLTTVMMGERQPQSTYAPQSSS